jgi:hypothetical protein
MRTQSGKVRILVVCRGTVLRSIHVSNEAFGLLENPRYRQHIGTDVVQHEAQELILLN